ncbi:MAG: hypothetical protein ACXACY_29240, partial [Candidatus Hodarchaeales archaeon]
AQDLKTEEVEVPEWGGKVLVRTITAKERDHFEKQLISGDKTDLENIRAKFIAATVVDEKGKLMFGELDLVGLGKKSASAMDKLFEVGQRLAGLKKEEVEEMVKN